MRPQSASKLRSEDNGHSELLNAEYSNNRNAAFHSEEEHNSDYENELPSDFDESDDMGIQIDSVQEHR
jgi:hypothetical protein